METSLSTTTTAGAAPTATTAVKVKNRASARSQVAQQWANRRLSASERPSSISNTITSSTATEGDGPKQHPRKPPSPPSQQQQQQQQQPSICHVIGKAWQEALMGISKQLPLKPASSLTNNATNSSSSTTATSIAENNKKALHKKEKGKSQLRTFPSVLQILQATALHQQVEHFHENNALENQESALRVLPQGYNWNKAIINMAQSRSRAFLLLDLASIVPTLVNWKQLCKGIQFMYTVQYNADPKLLQLLLRSNVGLVCTNKWDLERSQQALNSELSMSQQQQLYDNAITAGKPDGYLRHLILDAQLDTVVVDGPEEVIRIAQALKRMRQRRQQTDPSDKLNFILRLPSTAETSVWEDLVQSTQQAIEKCQQLSLIHTATLSGISADVQDVVEDTTKQSMMFSKLEQILAALASSEQPANDLRLDLTGVTMPPTKDMLEWWSRWSKFCSKITVDVSHALISPAGALCTRIIGVKDEQDEASGITKRHYYIDDGCYGSLYSPACDSNCNNNISISNPLPLLYDEETDDNDTVNASKPQEEPQISVIWGPTCDGLDKVAHDIMLPKMHRDQWLFFPNLGCRIGEGLGTAFNGFAPPDTAYCVLGYFGK